MMTDAQIGRKTRPPSTASSDPGVNWVTLYASTREPRLCNAKGADQS
jgi:hypothetical protein